MGCERKKIVKNDCENFGLKKMDVPLTVTGKSVRGKGLGRKITSSVSDTFILSHLLKTQAGV